MTAKEKLRRAFDAVYDRHPFLASIVASWKISWHPETNEGEWDSKQPGEFTAATNGPGLIVSARFLDILNISETTDLVLHEAGHIFLGHHLRFSGKPAAEWNVAADLALNSYIMRNLTSSSGRFRDLILMPSEKMFEDMPHGKDAEWYYDRLVQNMKDGKYQFSKDGTGLPMPSEGYEGLHKGLGDVLEHPDAPSQDDPDYAEKMQELMERNAQQVASGVNNAKACGDLPGWLDELVNGIWGKGQVDWKAYLRRFCTKFARNRMTYEKPNRRHGYRKDVIVPARRSREAAPGVIVVDTSGSMLQEEMNQVFAEVGNILSAYPACEVTVVQVDTREVGDRRKYTRFDFPIRCEASWSGRGGTDLGPAMAQVGRENSFKWMVVLSDMVWSYDTAPNPAIPVMWLMTRDVSVPPRFGIPVRIQVNA